MKRWKITVNTPSGWVMTEHEQGDYVLTSDVAELERKADALAEALAIARVAIATMPIDAFGTGSSSDGMTWPIRDELVDTISRPLAAYRGEA